MTFTSRLLHCRDTMAIYAYLLSKQIDERFMKEKGLLTVPLIRKSSFSTFAIDVTPFRGMDDNVRVRIFCTTGSLLITGCTSHLMCLSALEEIANIVKTPGYPSPTCAVPECRLINANCTLKYALNMSTVETLSRTEEGITLVESPERRAALILHLRDGTKVMVYSSGKFSVHGSSYASLHDARRICLPIFKQSRGFRTTM